VSNGSIVQILAGLPTGVLSLSELGNGPHLLEDVEVNVYRIFYDQDRNELADIGNVFLSVNFGVSGLRVRASTNFNVQYLNRSETPVINIIGRLSVENPATRETADHVEIEPGFINPLLVEVLGVSNALDETLDTDTIEWYLRFFYEVFPESR
jgi:hypothetical protein